MSKDIEIRIVPIPCPVCNDANVEAYLVNEKDMIMDCWKCGWRNHTNTDEWDWEEFGHDGDDPSSTNEKKGSQYWEELAELSKG